MSRVNWGQLTTPAIFVATFAVLAVFLHSGLQGEHGLVALHEAEALERELTQELARSQAEHAEIANLVSRIQDGNLDLDLLDERARAVLGYVRREDLIIR